MRSLMTFLAIFIGCSAAHAQQDEKAKAIIDKAVRAHGGEQNIMKLRVAEVKYTSWLALPGMEAIEITVHDTYQLPKQFKKITKGKQAGKDIDLTWAVINGGEKWWYRDGNGKTAVVNEPREIETLYRPYLILEQIVLISQDPDAKLALLEERKGNKRNLIGFKFTPIAGAATDMFFDKETGLVGFTEVKRSLPGAEKAGMQITFLSDYKNINGAMLFHKQLSTHNNKKVGEVRVLDVKTFEKFDDKVFAGP